MFGIWCALYILFDVSSSIYVSYQQAINGIDPTEFLSVFQLTTLGVVSLLFLPSLFGIYHLTKQYDSQKLKRVVRWLLVIMSVWTLGMVFCTIASAIMPGFMA